MGAKKQLNVVCCAATLRTDSDWNQVLASSFFAKVSSASLPSVGEGLSVHDALMRLKLQQSKDLQALMEEQPSQRRVKRFSRDWRAEQRDHNVAEQPYVPIYTGKFDDAFPLLGQIAQKEPSLFKAKIMQKAPVVAKPKRTPSRPASPQPSTGLSEAALDEIFGAARVGPVLARFYDLPDKFDRALEVLLEEHEEKEADYDILGTACQSCGAIVDDAEEEDVYCPACWATWDESEDDEIEEWDEEEEENVAHHDKITEKMRENQQNVKRDRAMKQAETFEHRDSQNDPYDDFQNFVVLAPKSERGIESTPQDQRTFCRNTQDIRKRFEKPEEAHANTVERTLSAAGVDEDILLYVCSMMQDEDIDMETLTELLSPWMTPEQVALLGVKDA